MRTSDYNSLITGEDEQGCPHPNCIGIIQLVIYGSVRYYACTVDPANHNRALTEEERDKEWRSPLTRKMDKKMHQLFSEGCDC